LGGGDGSHIESICDGRIWNVVKKEEEDEAAGTYYKRNRWMSNALVLHVEPTGVRDGDRRVRFFAVAFAFCKARWILVGKSWQAVLRDGGAALARVLVDGDYYFFLIDRIDRNPNRFLLLLFERAPRRSLTMSNCNHEELGRYWITSANFL